MAAEGSLVDGIQYLSQWRRELAIAFLALPILTWLGGRGLLALANRRATGAFLATTVYLAVLPGIPATMAVAFLLFFIRRDVLSEVDAVLFFGPIVCMLATLFAAAKVLPMREIPGFGRLRDLMLTTGLSFIAIYILYRLTFHLVFFGSWLLLIGAFVVLVIVLQSSASRLFGGDERAPGSID